MKIESAYSKISYNRVAIGLTRLMLLFIIPDAVFLGSSIRQSGRLLTARFQVRVLAEEPCLLRIQVTLYPLLIFKK